MRTVLVTGVGAIIGYGIIKSLRSSRFSVRIIGMDIYPDAIGSKWCDEFVQALPANHPDYLSFLRSLITTYNVDLVIPGIEQDIDRIAMEIDQLQVTNFAINNLELINVSRDKWLMNNKLLELGYSVIPTAINGEFLDLSRKLGVPMLLKPRISYASKGICRIDNDADFQYWKLKSGSNFMVQQIVGNDDEEYTVGAFGLGDGTTSGKIAFQRKLSGEGSTAKAKVVQLPELDKMVDRLIYSFKPIGPTNFQFRRHNNQFLLLEINPRISSSTSLRTAFGYNEAEMCMEYYVNGVKPGNREILRGSAIRYIEDAVTLE